MKEYNKLQQYIYVPCQYFYGNNIIQLNLDVERIQYILTICQHFGVVNDLNATAYVVKINPNTVRTHSLDGLLGLLPLFDARINDSYIEWFAHEHTEDKNKDNII